MIAYLRRCLRRRIIREGEWIDDFTAFGRGLCVGYRNPKHAQGYVLYWVMLPSYQWQRDLCTLRYGWHQAVLFWHGLTGFELHWVWVEGQQHSTSDEEYFEWAA